MSLRATLRQWQYPPEFRIDPPVWPPDLLARLEALARGTVDSTAAPPEPGPEPESMQFLADAGTGLWRLRQRMLEPGTGRPLDEMRRAYRHLESTWDALAQAGLQIIDHTGAPFDSGLAIKVIAFQPTAGLTREKVLETIKPSIYFKNARLQMGEVIVGTPADLPEGGAR